MTSTDPQRPNILVILTDDQGYWALGCAGNDEIVTPNLDQLANTGMRFENFFCVSPVCSPARASFLTGRIPSQHGVHDWIRRGNLQAIDADAGWDDDSAIQYLDGLTGYTDVLAQSGYICGISGKWHLGDSLAPQKGFSYWHVFPWGGGNYYGAYLIRNGRVERDTRYLTDVITEGGIRFLESQAESPAPFYLSVHYTAPHSPWHRGQHPPELAGLYADCPFDSCPDLPEVHPWQINSAPRGRGEKRHELLSGYFAAVSGLDRGVGQILGKLDELGIRDNTLVIFSSDNGMNMGHHGIWGKGNGTFPQNMYDTSVKVPALISRPGSVPQGKVSDHLLSHYDIRPTLLEYVGTDDPDSADLPGRSFAALLRGQEIDNRDQVVVFDEYGPVRMIRTREWKYVHRYPYGPHELFNLTNDPEEHTNLIDDGTYLKQIEEMKSRLDEWFARYALPGLDGTKEPVTGKGQLCPSGLAGHGQRAFASDWWYIDENGHRRARTEDGHCFQQISEETKAC